jgi:nitrite reductase/ring-hydroxylating ferredoxin subunit
LYKQRYNLDSGVCLDDESIKIDVYDAKIVAGRVHVNMALKH